MKTSNPVTSDTKRLPERVVRAVLAQQDAGERLVSWFQLGVVMVFGLLYAVSPIIFGAVGDATRMEYTVIGDAVNLAAKLEKHAKVEAVRALCTASTYETALRQGYRPPAERKKLNRRTIEGVTELQDIVILAE